MARTDIEYFLALKVPWKKVKKPEKSLYYKLSFQ